MKASNILKIWILQFSENSSFPEGKYIAFGKHFQKYLFTFIGNSDLQGKGETQGDSFHLLVHILLTKGKEWLLLAFLVHLQMS